MQAGSKRSSGLDFSDRASPPDVHPDVQPTHLLRNKTERRRLQGLMRTNSTTSSNAALTIPDAKKNQTWKARWDIWMVNEGGRRIFFFTWVFLHALVFALGFMHYQLKDNLTTARSIFGITFAIARTSALVLHVDVIFILLPVCRNFISLLRRTALNSVIPFDKNITFHKATAWSIVTFSVIHVVAHMINFVKLAIVANPTINGNQQIGARIVTFILTNFTTGPGITGWIMNVVLFIMVWFAIEKRRRANFERFWYSHHLFIVFFICWQLHGMFCMIKPDRPPYCSFNTIGVFWRYWLVGGLIWIWERVLREIRSRHRTYISKVIQHPSGVMEVQIKKEKTTTRAGQ